MDPAHPRLTIRRAGGSDLPFLRDMAFLAARWRPRRDVEEKARIPEDDHVARYVDGWGRPGDVGVIAELDGQPVGAAWLRLLGRNCPGYGFIDERTPELSVAVAASRRGAGVGSRLLGGLLEAAAAVGYEAVSLSVEADNPALQLYERLGFRKVAQTGGAWTMRLDLRTSVPPTDPVGAVHRGYDAAAASYAAARDPFQNTEHLEWFRDLLPPPANVLDVGCGSGVPIDRYLVDHGYDVTGIDLSAKQIELARASVPEAQFEVVNVLELKPREYRVGGIVSFYAIFHTPRGRHAEVLKTLATFLRPGGVMLITMGASEYEGREMNFHGVEMHWSHFGPERNCELVEAAGFDIQSDEIESVAEERHQIIWARRR